MDMDMDMYRCVECGFRIKTLFVQYSPGNIRLMKCVSTHFVFFPFLSFSFLSSLNSIYTVQLIFWFVGFDRRIAKQLLMSTSNVISWYFFFSLFFLMGKLIISISLILSYWVLHSTYIYHLWQLSLLGVFFFWVVDSSNWFDSAQAQSI